MEGYLNAYHIARAEGHRDTQHSKKIYWRNYVSKMNSQTSVKSECNWIRKTKVKYSSYTVHLSMIEMSQESKDRFGRRDVVESFRIYPHTNSVVFKTK